MSSKDLSSRRSFFFKAGAAVSVPLVAATADGFEGDSGDAATIEARLAELEDLSAIRELEQTFSRHINRRAWSDAAQLFAKPGSARFDEGIVGLVINDDGGNEIELAPDGRSATSRVRCTVEIETAINLDCTLVRMAREQGEGYVRSAGSRVLVNEYEKRGAVWKIRNSSWHPA